MGYCEKHAVYGDESCPFCGVDNDCDSCGGRATHAVNSTAYCCECAVDLMSTTGCEVTFDGEAKGDPVLVLYRDNQGAVLRSYVQPDLVELADQPDTNVLEWLMLGQGYEEHYRDGSVTTCRPL